LGQFFFSTEKKIPLTQFFWDIAKFLSEFAFWLKTHDLKNNSLGRNNI